MLNIISVRVWYNDLVLCSLTSTQGFLPPLIICRGFSPLEGFMDEQQYQSVVQNNRLSQVILIWVFKYCVLYCELIVLLFCQASRRSPFSTCNSADVVRTLIYYCIFTTALCCQALFCIPGLGRYLCKCKYEPALSPVESLSRDFFSLLDGYVRVCRTDHCSGCRWYWTQILKISK